MGAFSGQLRTNEIFAAIFNMIISQQVFADNISGTFSELVDKARVEGSKFGDTKLYYSTDVLKSHPWTGDSEAANLLNINRPDDPECQEIVIDHFRQIDITIDNYLTARAWTDVGAFSSFNSIILGWIGDTKRIYDSTTYNAFFGTEESTATRGVEDVNIDVLEDKEASNRLEAQQIAEAVSNILVDMRDVSRDFNDYKHLRSYALSDIKIVWNSKFLNKIKKIDLPTIFNKDGLMDKFEDFIPARYFGVKITSTNVASLVYNASTNPTGPLSESSGTYTISTASGRLKVRTLVERDVTVSDTTTHLFAGERMPNGATFTDADVADIYYEDEDVICKIYTKLPPFMSGFQVATSFFNARSLTENHYLTWSHNTLERLFDKPLITLKAEYILPPTPEVSK